MSVTTSQQFNPDQLMLPPGAYYTWVGAPLESTGEKILDPVGTDDPTLQAAVDTAAAAFVDRKQNYATLLNQARNAVTANKTYIALPSPTQAQAGAQITALTKQMNALIKLVGGNIDDLTGT
jgi:hypothetical protein